jgi:hypothetical protein
MSWNESRDNRREKVVATTVLYALLGAQRMSVLGCCRLRARKSVKIARI